MIFLLKKLIIVKKAFFLCSIIYLFACLYLL